MSDNPFTPLATIQDHPPPTSQPPPTSRPGPNPIPEAPGTGSTTRGTGSSSRATPGRRKKHRGGKKTRTRRESFAPLQGDSNAGGEPASARDVARASLYDLQRNLSGSSLNSEVHSSSRFATFPTARNTKHTSQLTCIIIEIAGHHPPNLHRILHGPTPYRRWPNSPGFPRPPLFAIIPVAGPARRFFQTEISHIGTRTLPSCRPHILRCMPSLPTVHPPSTSSAENPVHPQRRSPTLVSTSTIRPPDRQPPRLGQP